jgi:predicted nucleic acid-binding protein
MNGRFVLDTNAVIALLSGHSGLLTLLNSAVWVGISIVTELEFLSFPNLSANDAKLFHQFKNRVDVIGLVPSDANLLQQIVQIRKRFKLKLPDSIIAALTIQQQAVLISNDAVFERISELSLQQF